MNCRDSFVWEVASIGYSGSSVRLEPRVHRTKHEEVQCRGYFFSNRLWFQDDVGLCQRRWRHGESIVSVALILLRFITIDPLVVFFQV